MSSSFFINGTAPFLSKSKLSSINETNSSFKDHFPSASAKFPGRIVFRSFSRSSSITSSKSGSVLDSVSSLPKKMVDWDEDADYDDDGEEKLPNKVPTTVRCSSQGIGLTVRDPRYPFPWKREEEEDCESGFVISGQRVLTSSSAVNLHREVKLKKSNCDKWYTATVLAIAIESDLAILTVDDGEFWKGVKPVEFGDMPSPKEMITVTGYPEKSDSVCMIRCRVSSISMTGYLAWGARLLAFQVKMVVDSGIIGGPVFNGRGEVVGMMFQYTDDKIEFVPAELIKHFIQDYDKNGAYTGLPLLGIKWQKMENSSLRVFMKMEHDQQGVLITEVKPNYPEFEMLKPYDVILSIDGININNDGTVPFKRGQRIEFNYLIAKKYKGDKIAIRVLRDSKILELVTELPTHKQFVPANTTGRLAQYYIIGGLVFTSLSTPYLQVVDEQYDLDKTPDGDEVLSQAFYEERVVLCKVLKDEITTGYEEEDKVENQVLLSLNDKFVNGLKGLVTMVEHCDEEFLKFTFQNHKILVLPTRVARERTSDILKAYNIPDAMSDDLKE